MRALKLLGQSGFGWRATCHCVSDTYAAPRPEKSVSWCFRSQRHRTDHNLGGSATNTRFRLAHGTHAAQPPDDHAPPEQPNPTQPDPTDIISQNGSHYYASLWSVVFEPDMEEKLHALPAETMTDMPHCIYPEGLYCALKTMSTIGHPLYVTENGVADADDTRRRCAFAVFVHKLGGGT